MADAPHIPDEAETRARWGAFEWTAENAEQAKKVIAMRVEAFCILIQKGEWAQPLTPTHIFHSRGLMTPRTLVS